ncbi:hypothetical protein DAETH_10700 [Deinococcus aetherius]|uniref:Outer membrane protein beta-barrel domain-containing protein n=1 Tax=Deinococcus aetherius TaxID=200252 RepID=A0ABN6RCT6_9DEIO|nr:hypothetical protein [Deinococcus aetherius]BDP41101.1 hypothetical protein DAETH_10700 [Deinococcus aetherius]
MKKLLALTISAGLATAGAQTLGVGFSTGGGLELGLTGGYANGLSGEAFVHAPNLAGPFGLKVGASYTRAADAINDSSPVDPTGTLFPTTYTFGQAKQDGVASESGSHTVLSVDGTYNVGELTPGVGATLYAGGRYGFFRSTEDYGTSGSTTYSSNAFGIGAGVMVSYALAGNLSLVGDLGVDQFFGSSINTGSDTFQQGEAGYSAISNKFVRPGTVFKARIGVKTTF